MGRFDGIYNTDFAVNESTANAVTEQKLKKIHSKQTVDKKNESSKGPIQVIHSPENVVNKRVFGCPIDPEIHKILLNRQFSNAGINPNEAMTISVTGGEQAIPGGSVAEGFELEPIDVVGSSKNSFKTLSEQTPWVRMWTAIRSTSFTNAKPVGEQEIKTAKSDDKTFYFEKNNRFFKMDRTINEFMVYEIGNNNYSNYVASPNSPILDGHHLNSPTWDPSEFNSVFDTELNNNQFDKPAAGITSVNSVTEGTLGAIKRTTVNFIVHNFDDFENIYLKYFLKPGATIFIDLGWSDSAVYNNRDVILDNGGQNAEKIIFGKNGILSKYPGELEILLGVVTKYSAKVLPNGSFDCSVEIVSKNEALINHQIESSDGLQSRSFSFLNQFLVISILKELGVELGSIFANIDPEVDKIAENDVADDKNIVNSWGRIIFGGGLKTTNVPKTAVEQGLYWQEIPYREYVEKSHLGGLYKKKGRTSTNDKNLYITWGFFEDKFLNNELGMFSVGDAKNLDSTINAKFNTWNVFVPLDKNLQKRQYSILDKTSLIFLYPSDWGELETESKTTSPETLNLEGEKYHSYSYGKNKYDGLQKQHEHHNLCPLSELWINVSVIQQAFADKNTVSEALVDIIDTISEAAFDTFDLKLSTNDNAATSISVVDRNFADLDDDDFNGLFVFKPHSPQSIVTDMNLEYNTPQGGLQNMLAIQNTTSAMFPYSSNIDMNLALKGLLAFENKNTFEYLPYSDTGLSKIKERLNKKEANKQNGPTNIVDDHVVGTSEPLDKALGNIYNVESEEYEEKLEQLMDISKAYEQKLIAEEQTELLEKAILNPTLNNSKTSENQIGEDDDENKQPTSVIESTFVDSLDEYYGLLAKDRFYYETFDTILPMELQLTIYGISGIIPGDLFRVDYLPRQIRQNVYFQAVTIGHDVTPSGWQTNITAVPRMRKKLKSDLLTNPEGSLPVYQNRIINTLKLSRQFLLTRGVNPEMINLFKDFKVIDDPKVNPFIDVFIVQGYVSDEAAEAGSGWAFVPLTGQNKQKVYKNFTNNLHSWFTDKTGYSKNTWRDDTPPNVKNKITVSDYFPLEVDMNDTPKVYVVISGFKNLVLPGNVDIKTYLENIMKVSYYSKYLRQQPPLRGETGAGATEI